jgi:hypothetical protein
VSPSQIIAGASQLSERVLGQSIINEAGGGWAGGFTGRVGLKQHSLTVTNPAGATVQGVMDLTCYTGIGGSVIQGSLSVDGGGQSVWGILYWNLVSTHFHFWWPWSVAVGPGAHTFNVGIWVAAGNVYFDSNDGGTSVCWERI